MPEADSFDALAERAASCLTPRERRILRMSAAEGRGCEAIAHELGMRTKTVERILIRALARFDQALERLRSRG